MGPLIVCRPGILNMHNERTDGVDREFALMFMNIDENFSWYIRDNVRRYAPRRRDLRNSLFVDANIKRSINGFIYGNVPGLLMREGEHVTWYVFGGGEQAHTVHFHGQTVIQRTSREHRSDVIEVFPGTYDTVDMVTDNPGTWLVHCHVSVHMRDGMSARFTILPHHHRQFQGKRKCCVNI
jgi:hephaestin